MNPLLPKSKPGQAVKCGGCKHHFPQDPCFEIKCPACGANPGAYCKRPSDHSGPFVPFHRDRDLRAFQLGFYDHDGGPKCGPRSDSPRGLEILKKYGLIDKTLSEKNWDRIRKYLKDHPLSHAV